MKWNNCINQQENYKGCMLQMLQSQNYDLQQIIKLEGSMCTQKNMKGENERLFKTIPLYTIS